jgi:ADP-heptose:LPS heptosyltransferase
MPKAAIFLIDGFEETEAIATVDLLRRGTVETDLVSLNPELTAKGSHGVVVTADLLLKDINPKNKPYVKRVFICRPNSRLGNQIMVIPVVQEIIEMYTDCKIDLFVRGNLSAILFEKYENIDRIIKLPKKPFKQLFKYLKVWFSIRKHRYDLAVNIDGYSSSGRLATKLVKAKIKLFNDINNELSKKYSDYVHMAKFPVYNLRYALSPESVENPIPALNIRLSAVELANGKKVLDNIVSGEKKTIGIYTFATGGKCYSETLWMQMYERIKAKYGAKYNILEILPIENVSQIGFAAPSYYSKDIREIAALMANTALFFGADSGMMHLASAVQTPTIGLFSVTSVEMYQPYNKGSIAINPTTMPIDDIIGIIENILM